MVCALGDHVGDGGLGGDAFVGGVEHNPHCLQEQHDCRPMALVELDMEVGHDDDVDYARGGVGGSKLAFGIGIS